MLTVKKKRGGHYTAILDGEFTIYNAAQFKQELVPHLEKCKSMVFDLSGVSEMDTSCFQLLVQSKKELQQSEREMSMVGHSPAVQEILDLYGMVDFFGDPIVLSAEQ
jgi:anti-anti-sigma factor